jgi:hypothetical protein
MPLPDPNQSVGLRSSLRFAGQEPSLNKPTSSWAQRRQVTRPLQLLVLLSPPEELSDANYESAIFTTRVGLESVAAEAWLPVLPWALILGAGQCHRDLRIVKLHIHRRPSSPSRRLNIAARAHTSCQPQSLPASDSGSCTTSLSPVSASMSSLHLPLSVMLHTETSSSLSRRNFGRPEALDPPAMDVHEQASSNEIRHGSFAF